MRVRKIKNISNHTVTAQLAEGATMDLPPGVEVKNVRVENLSELRPDCDIVSDLGEVSEDRRSSKTKLFG